MLTLNNIEETDQVVIPDSNSSGNRTKVKKFDLFDFEQNKKISNDWRFDEDILGEAEDVQYTKVGKESPDDTLRRMSIKRDSINSISPKLPPKMSSFGGRSISKKSSMSPRKSKFAGTSEDVDGDNSLEFNPYGMTSNPKKNISKFGSTNSIEKRSKEKSEEKKEEEPCIICYTNPQNSVCMPCGHGSTCIDCANTFITDTGKCSICREKVDKMIQIDLDEVNNGCFKVKKVFFFLDDDEEEEKGNEEGQEDAEEKEE